MKNVIISILILIFISSCSKKEPIIIEKEGLFLSFNCDSNRVLAPSVSSATLNDSLLIISGKYIDNINMDCYRTMRFSVITNNTQNGTTYLNADSEINQIGFFLEENIPYLINTKFNDNGNHDYIIITEIDKTNKTISGKFANFLIKGYFNKLHYSNQIDENSLFYFAKTRLFAENDTLNISGSYQTDNIYINNELITIYLNDDLVLEFKTDYEIGIHNLYANDYLLIRIRNQASNTFYRQPIGKYIVSDTLIYNHNYKKIYIEADLTEALIDSSFSNSILTIDNTEILIY